MSKLEMLLIAFALALGSIWLVFFTQMFLLGTVIALGAILVWALAILVGK